MGFRKHFDFVMIHCITLEMTVIAACANLVCSVGLMLDTSRPVLDGESNKKL
jgi:hypothetical protein